MILSAGLTPAWQQILVFDSFRYGEVNRADEVHWCASGKCLNVGIGVHTLGLPSLTLAPAGGPPLREIEREFALLEAPHRWIETRAATRVCTTILERPTGRMTELVENGRPLMHEELDAYIEAYFEEAAKADLVVLIGSLPFGTPESVYRQLLERTKCPAVLDFRGGGLLSVLDLKPYIVKPNREEMTHTFRDPLETDRELHVAMRSLNRQGAQWVVVTQGRGPVWVSSLERLYRFETLPTDMVVNPIGCGDAMAAALAAATYEGGDIVEAVSLGIAAAAENLRQLLPCRLDRNAVAQRAAEVRVERVE